MSNIVTDDDLELIKTAVLAMVEDWQRHRDTHPEQSMRDLAKAQVVSWRQLLERLEQL